MWYSNKKSGALPGLGGPGDDAYDNSYSEGSGGGSSEQEPPKPTRQEITVIPSNNTRRIISPGYTKGAITYGPTYAPG